MLARRLVKPLEQLDHAITQGFPGRDAVGQMTNRVPYRQPLVEGQIQRGPPVPT